ncbi:MAG: hypothetical protein MUC29_01045 [Pyrinomonadaceae bacterium]|jgi:hypothetical protein|nr:hypothetical protein [Pyrinomonadaceae bacterium]
MKKEVISVFDGKTERKATLAEKLGITFFLVIIIPIILFVLFLLFALFLMVCCGKK